MIWAVLIAITLALWSVVAVATARRVEFPPAILAIEALLGAVVTGAMVVMLAATALWWGAMANDAPKFLNASPGGISGSPWDIWLTATVALMAIALSAAVLGVIRAARVSIKMRGA